MWVARVLPRRPDTFILFSTKNPISFGSDVYGIDAAHATSVYPFIRLGNAMANPILTKFVFADTSSSEVAQFVAPFQINGLPVRVAEFGADSVMYTFYVDSLRFGIERIY